MWLNICYNSTRKQTCGTLERCQLSAYPRPGCQENGQMAADALTGQLAQLTIKDAKWFQIHSAPSIVLSSEPLTLCPNRNMVWYEGTGRSCILQDSFSGTICQGTLDLPS
ncbi:hypothetical protein RLOC_00012513 [Lonchura striata]|uniref:Uncharacterized protein n=1 Tax=Lonchura striata TaxID=40157 RepID=A0A218V7Y3_9PASE|nr:hypothetical protein RLOC_00012513 [Lonchura striata domestica]